MEHEGIIITLHAPVVSNPREYSSLIEFLLIFQKVFVTFQLPVSGRTTGPQDVLYPAKDGHNLE